MRGRQWNFYKVIFPGLTYQVFLMKHSNAHVREGRLSFTQIRRTVRKEKQMKQ